MKRALPLADAVAKFVRPGMHLHFASSPSRSNAAIRELARRFRGLRPEFVLSTTGFHSTAHLLGLLRLGRKYVACFFGDNYPTPRPNRLYETLASEGAELEHWSLLTYVQALRAAALGHPYAVTRSLAGTTLGERLGERGKFFEVPDPRAPERRVGLLAPLAPDVTFVHAAAADASGRAIFSPPHGEGFFSAFAAREGVIVTAERLLDERELDNLAHRVAFPPQRVLAVCEEPFGAHPQPLHVAPPLPEVASYGDDYAAYQRWREIAEGGAAFRAFERAVLDAPDGGAGYREYVGSQTLNSLYEPSSAPRSPRRETPAAEEPASDARLPASQRLVLLAARTIARRVRAAGHGSVLAGIGQSFAAVRLGLLLLGATRDEVELTIETGISGVDLWNADPFLLSRENAASASRLSSVETDLGAVACGGANRCLAVIGCAEADAAGSVNSSYAGGRLLVGSGGASDLASAAREVIVLCPRERLVARVEYVTSPGARVRAIVTEDAVLEREAPDVPWRLGALAPGVSAHELGALPFEVIRDGALPRGDAVSRREVELLTHVLGGAPRRPVHEVRLHA